ncbi:RNA pyrophosphohydrolase [Ignatzschineria cameli]|uniref:RNA pyrophosphohydrolase n=1 Tax=Ignatzschineria cameli TaxID=2182793 RepID=A0A2U2AR71_9GAMM|nr:RNA pyrophosphohydrolase [Ignatzschineria cameli]PWD85183.1 RNA pyrophosphohydrolase [Ignatzschineria cameli]PWD86391.1 RNA pyrophosphohydrolase [Ignatzschineria cameli]PWD89771.1 RNA pyrophosphohydrolase [Ignatzschineria cameli]PWD91421.1 RNA pyrophosphohydrolase [Ignatzschineria cameli]PWD92459.1 RNA pyrophosphohydrolase [Ignatzschineria cameli]
MIDNDGFRANVGIILCNQNQQLFWGHRIGQLDAWQFPQGGIDPDETPEEAMYRELYEEVGLRPEHIKILGRTDRWLRYRLPHNLIRRNHLNERTCIGQKQVWYMLEFVGDEEDFNLNAADHPEFDHYKWVDYWLPLRDVIHFKRKVYDKALTELAPLIFERTVPKKPKDLRSRRRHSLFRMHSRRQTFKERNGEKRISFEERQIEQHIIVEKSTY